MEEAPSSLVAFSLADMFDTVLVPYMAGAVVEAGTLVALFAGNMHLDGERSWVYKLALGYFVRPAVG